VSENAGAQPVAEERKKLGIALKRVAAQEDRVTEAYVSEAMDLDRYKEEMDKLKSHRQELDKSSERLTSANGRNRTLKRHWCAWSGSVTRCPRV